MIILEICANEFFCIVYLKNNKKINPKKKINQKKLIKKISNQKKLIQKN